MSTLFRGNRLPIAIGLVAVVLFAGFAIFGGGGDDSGQVKVACRDWVKDRLKSPGSADFSGEAVSQDGKTYVVTGAVDSDNSFGAAIRNHYRCEATHDDGRSVLVSLDGLGQ